MEKERSVCQNQLNTCRDAIQLVGAFAFVKPFSIFIFYKNKNKKGKLENTDKMKSFFLTSLAVACFAVQLVATAGADPSTNCECTGVCKIGGGAHFFPFSGKHAPIKDTTKPLTIYENKKFFNGFKVTGQTLSKKVGSLIHSVWIKDGFLPGPGTPYVADVYCPLHLKDPKKVFTKKMETGTVTVEVACQFAQLSKQLEHPLWHFHVQVTKTNNGAGNFEDNEKGATGICATGIPAATSLRSGNGARLLGNKKSAPRCTCTALCTTGSSGDSVQSFDGKKIKLANQENQIVFQEGKVKLIATKSNGIITALTATASGHVQGDKTIEHTVADCENKEQELGKFVVKGKTSTIETTVSCLKTKGLFSLHRMYLHFEVKQTVNSGHDESFDQQSSALKGSGFCVQHI